MAAVSFIGAVLIVILALALLRLTRLVRCLRSQLSDRRRALRQYDAQAAAAVDEWGWADLSD